MPSAGAPTDDIPITYTLPKASALFAQHVCIQLVRPVQRAETAVGSLTMLTRPRLTAPVTHSRHDVLAPVQPLISHVFALRTFLLYTSSPEVWFQLSLHL
jgi:hypothetical protein